MNDDLHVETWLTLPDVAERLGTDVGRVRRMLQERRLVAVRRGEHSVLSVPDRFLAATAPGGWEVIPALQGTLVLLGDAGYTEEQSIRWLFAPDPSLVIQGTSLDRPLAPIDALAAGHKTEIRRRAQGIAF